MTPADVPQVPDDLVRAGLDAVWRPLTFHSLEADVRDVLAVVLPLHERRLRDRIADAIWGADDACGDSPCDCCRAQRDVSVGIVREGGDETEPGHGD